MEAYNKNPNYNYNPKLPKPEVIYEKDFHFLDETLLAKEQRRAAKKKKKKEAKQELDGDSPKREEKKKMEFYTDSDAIIKSEEKDRNKDPQSAGIINMSNQAITQQKLTQVLEKHQIEKKDQNEELAQDSLLLGAGQVKKGLKEKVQHQKEESMILLNNQKDIPHDLIDRSLSKIRASNKQVAEAMKKVKQPTT